MLRDWLAAHFVFLADPVGVGVFGVVEDIELLRDPLESLRRIQATGQAHGDCDDAAMLAAAVTRAAGLPTRFRVVGFQAGGAFSHVFAEALTAHGWMHLDVTRPSADLPTVQRTAVLGV